MNTNPPHVTSHKEINAITVVHSNAPHKTRLFSRK